MYYVDEFIEFSKELIELKEEKERLFKINKEIQEEIRILKKAIQSSGEQEKIDSYINIIKKEEEDNIPF